MITHLSATLLFRFKKSTLLKSMRKISYKGQQASLNLSLLTKTACLIQKALKNE